ncbi:uncharacterized protein FA14DRAFT_154272 [Meira miltonrushii]|uniref:BOD1/SHG1 domain-containing protein n=1 Tax=Meira miltonrushii TaxID=1280837 RepID=A0A316VCI4_9BASI|nr:uncharacterized protein FA14DRAFT_154272 [Meira miltonrushii]PWN34838.1 hypothetical protein FA14DRAFT_154272 [Meira miltonrushii]
MSYSYNSHARVYGRRDDRYSSGSYGRSSYGERGYDRERDRYRSAPYISSYLSRPSSSYRSSLANHTREEGPRSHRTNDSDRADHAGSKVSEDRNGIKTRDLGYAFIGREKHHYLKTELRSQLSDAAGKEDRDESEGSPAVRLTPRDVVEECRKSGHLDAIRKEILQEFQASKLKETFFERLEKYILERMEALSPKERQKLAGQDQRLQHAELTRWIEEGKGAADIFDDLFKQLQGKSGEEDQIGIFAQQDGRLEKDIRGRLQDVISDKKRMQSAANEADSDDEEDSSMNTPIFKSSATPSGRDTPRDVGSMGGNQTPLPS